MCRYGDDFEDADGDSVPDFCDRCPIGSDADDDADGYADLCDQALFAQRFDGSISAPYESMRVDFIVRDRDDASTVHAVVSIDAPIGEPFAVGDDAIGHLARELGLNTPSRHLVVQMVYNGGMLGPTTHELPVGPPYVLWQRAVVRGLVEGSRHRLDAELRGYVPER